VAEVRGWPAGRRWRVLESGQIRYAPCALLGHGQRSETWEQEADQFRRARADKAANEQPIRLLRRWCPVLLHILPLGRLTESVGIFTGDWTQTLIGARHFPRGRTNYRPNIDGLYIDHHVSGRCVDYTQILRCGGFEHYSDAFAYIQDDKPVVNLFGITGWLFDTTKKNPLGSCRIGGLSRPHTLSF
jgi:hypothetical protein